MNKEVESLVNSGTMGKRSSYLKVMAEQRATIGKYISEYGIINAIHHFVPNFPEGALKEAQSMGGREHTCLKYNLDEGKKAKLIHCDCECLKKGKTCNHEYFTGNEGNDL